MRLPATSTEYGDGLVASGVLVSDYLGASRQFISGELDDRLGTRELRVGCARWYWAIPTTRGGLRRRGRYH